MKLKTFLMGSAAALMTASTVHAADAVIAEPEPVEYVRVCDAVGAGYFFIPGSETCIQFSGDIRVQYDYVDGSDAFDGDGVVFADVDGNPLVDVNGDPIVGDGDEEDGQFDYRARLNVRTALESDFGTITTFTRFEGGTGLAGSDANVDIDQAIIGIGDFSIGYGDYFWARNQGFGLLGAIRDGAYGYNQSVFAEYSFAANGFSATVGLEQVFANDALIVTGDGTAGDPFIVTDTGNRDNGEDLNFYAGARYGGSWGFVSGTIAYDGLTENLAYNAATNLIFGGFRVEAFGSIFSDDSVYGASSGNLTGGDYAWGAGASYTFGDITPYALYSDADVDDGSYVSVGAYWTPASTGILLQGEATFRENDIDQYTLRLVKSF